MVKKRKPRVKKGQTIAARRRADRHRQERKRVFNAINWYMWKYIVIELH